jgi:hypothetical protein
LFSLRGKQGASMTVSVSKEGYYASHRGQAFIEYSKMRHERYVPDSGNPVVFNLRKRGKGADTLLTSQSGMREGFWVNAPRDGTPVKVDLLGRKVGSGSVEMAQKKPDYPAHGGAAQYLSRSDLAKWEAATNWSFTMKIADGGFLAENEEFPFYPPESGYEPVVNFNFQKGQTNWTTELKRDFYIRFGNPPVYGQLNIETSSFGNMVILTYIINPDGSRYLEPKEHYFPSSSRWTH